MEEKHDVKVFVPTKTKIIKPIYIVVFIIIVIVIILGIILLNGSKSNVNKATGVVPSLACTSNKAGSVLDDSAKLIKTKDVLGLSTKVKTIESLTNYQNDPNCLYVITIYYVYDNDAPNSTKYLKMFESVYNNQHLNKNLLALVSVTQLKADVSFVVKESTALKQRSQPIYSPSLNTKKSTK